MVLVFLIYGLAFVVLGVAIFATPRTAIGPAWARSLTWIGWFGILHGTNEWVDLLNLVDPATYGGMHDLLSPVLLVSSFACLLVYGGQFLARECRSPAICRWMPAVLLAAWGLAVLVSNDATLTAHIGGRYLLGLPGALVTTAALIVASRNPELDREPNLRLFLRLAAGGFAVYAIAAGLVGPAASFFPASTLNQQAFAEWLGFPIQLVRTACAIVIAVGLGRLLLALDRQTRQALVSAHEALEVRVAARTTELAAANDALLVEAERRDRLQAEVLKTEKLESLGIFAGGIAHDYNNLLTAILGSLSLADRHLTEEHPATQALERADKAARKAQELAQRLLTFARGGEPDAHPCSIADILEDACSLCLSGTNIRADLNLAPDTPAVVADPSQMTQVFNNLVTNARQAMAGGGTLRVSARPVTIGSDDETLAAGAYVQVTIIDEGRGIDPSDLEHVFDPFFTRRDGGSGLGLAVAHSVIRQHRGKITVNSKIDQGTTVVVFLPTSAAAPVEQKARPHLAPKHGSRVLVMDDDELVRETAAGILSRCGCTVVTTADGDEAISAFTSAAESGEPFDVVILDLTVPGGMGGRETIARLQVVDPDVRAIVSSGYSTDPVAKRFAHYGFAASLGKPYSADELCAAVAEVIAVPSSNSK